MKKMLLLIGIISTTMFAATPGKPALNQMPPEAMEKEMVHHGTGKMTPEMMKEEEQYQNGVSEKKAEIQKETSKEKPDWNKVHKLHKEVGEKHAEHATKMMKMNHENK